MRWVPFALVAALGVLLQTTLMRLAIIGDAFPDLLVALLVTFGLGVRPAEGFVVGAALGLGRDLFSVEPLGMSTAVFAALGWLVARERPATLADHFVVRAVMGFLCSAAASLASLLALGAQGTELDWRFVASRLGLSALATALLTAILGGLIWQRPRWFGLRRRSEFADV